MGNVAIGVLVLGACRRGRELDVGAVFYARALAAVGDARAFAAAVAQRRGLAVRHGRIATASARTPQASSTRRSVALFACVLLGAADHLAIRPT